MAVTALFPLKAGKRSISTALGKTTDYVKNPEKTDDGEWISAFECDPLTVESEFTFAKSQYAKITGRDQGNHDVIAYHLRQSFKPGEVEPETANKIGYELAKRLTKGKHAFVCCTHTDKHHIHNHIIINSTSLDFTRKFRNFKNSSFAIRKISDLLCAEYGLSIVAHPKPSHNRDYGNWIGDRKPKTGRAKLREMIDHSLSVGISLTEFFARLKQAGCEVKAGKQVSIKPPESKKFFHLNTLGDDYNYNAIMERLYGKRFPKASKDTPSLLIDIQAKMADGKGRGYEQWAQIFNVKQMAKTLLFLQEQGIGSYEELVAKSSDTSGKMRTLNNRIRDIESLQKSISTLQRQIGTYSKTRKVYEAYKASRWSKKFYDAHSSDLTLYKAARKFFDEHQEYHPNGKLPSISSLKSEWATLDSEKRSLYQEYHSTKGIAKELTVAQRNAEEMLFGENQHRTQQKVIGVDR